MDWAAEETLIVAESRVEYGLTEGNYRKLRIWQAGLALALNVYRATAKFPTDEKFGLTSQMRRAAVSIPSNIAEGDSRRTDADFLRFLTISIGSLNELETQIEISDALGYLADSEELRQSCNQLARTLTLFRRKVESRF